MNPTIDLRDKNSDIEKQLPAFMKVYRYQLCGEVPISKEEVDRVMDFIIKTKKVHGL